MSGTSGHLGKEATKDELSPSYLAGLADSLLSAGLIEEAYRLIDLAYAAADRRCSAVRPSTSEPLALTAAEPHQN